ncbi:MAG: ATP-binding protein [Treponema sp.]|nr:ATP-binding protein [Treponema sp.]
MAYKQLIPRKQYLDTLIRLKDKQLIKIVTGIRRCGKSTLFDLYEEYLLNNGVKKENIIRINFESPQFIELWDWLALYRFIKERLQANTMNYILLDEIQNVPDFQLAVDGLFILDNSDVYITGSNAYLLSGELATLLSGRFIEIKMLPLSFKEYLSAFTENQDRATQFRRFIQFGSFPYVLWLEEEQDIQAYLEGIYTTVILKDVLTRKKIADPDMLQRVVKFLADNIGSPISATSIANTLTSHQRKVSFHTVENYLAALMDSFIFYRVQRYDIKGKQHLSTGAKYYLCDVGLRYYMLGTKPGDFGHILENIVYLELVRRGNEVYVGKVNDTEIDFIAIHKGEKSYYQVAYTVMELDGNDRILQRELRPLQLCKDNNQKFLLTMDNVPPVSHDGIKQCYVLDWLLQD